MIGAVSLMQLHLRLERRLLAGRRDWSKPQCLTCTRSFVERGCTEENINVCILDHEHFCCCEDGCVASITVLSHREERHVQVRDVMTFSSRRWKSKRKETF